MENLIGAQRAIVIETGRLAAETGHSLFDNPYIDVSEKGQAWILGFMLVKKVIETEVDNG